MPIHEIIEPFTVLWWKGIVSCIVFISLIILFLYDKSIEFKQNIIKYFAYSAIFVYISTIIYSFYLGTWTIKDFLPFHLCNISYFICILLLLFKKKWMYEWSLLLGMPSAFHALITPELIWGSTNWYLFEYYFMHGSLILVPLYLMILMKLKLRTFSWLKTFFRVQVVFVSVFIFNLLFDTNYMFLMFKPLVNNPLIIGDWPDYILIIQFIGFLHISLIYKLAPKHS